jgi:hypothetical protein
VRELSLINECYSSVMTLIIKVGFSTAGVLLIVGISLIAFYGSSESFVDEEGLLVEEFSALALGSFALFAAIIVGVISSFASFVRLVRGRNT